MLSAVSAPYVCIFAFLSPSVILTKNSSFFSYIKFISHFIVIYCM